MNIRSQIDPQQPRSTFKPSYSMGQFAQDVQQDAVAVAELLRTSGWVQGRRTTPDGRMCLSNAMGEVCQAEHPILGKMVRGYHGLALAIQELTGTGPITFNDQNGRTLDEVLAMLNRIATS